MLYQWKCYHVGWLHVVLMLLQRDGTNTRSLTDTAQCREPHLQVRMSLLSHFQFHFHLSPL